MINITNEKIISFFNENPNIDPETLFINLIDIYNYIRKTVDSDNNDQLLPYILENKSLINNLNNKIDGFNQINNINFNNIKSEIQKDINNLLDFISNNIKKDEKIETKLNNISNLINDNDKNFINIMNNFKYEISCLLDNNVDKIKNSYFEILDKNKDKTVNEIIMKLKENNDLISSNILPKIERAFDDKFDVKHIMEQISKDLDDIDVDIKLDNKNQIQYLDNIHNFLINNKNNISKEVTDNIRHNNDLICKSLDNSLISEFHNNFLPKIENIINKTNINKLNSEFIKHFNDLKNSDLVVKNQIDNIVFKFNNMDKKIEFINNKFSGSSNKGNIGEHVLFSLLNNIYPSLEIENTSKEGHRGDFILKHDSDILIETKDYDSNVKSLEVKKFEKDCFNNKLSGIFLSHNSGIANKKNFQIDIDKARNILLYIHNVKYNEDLIKLGIDIICHYNKVFKNDDDIKNVVTDDEFNRIKNDYENFLVKKNENIKYLDTFNKEFKKRIFDMDLPFLNTIFCNITSLNNDINAINCPCGYKAKNNKGLATHKRSCKLFKK